MTYVLFSSLVFIQLLVDQLLSQPKVVNLLWGLVFVLVGLFVPGQVKQSLAGIGSVELGEIDVRLNDFLASLMVVVVSVVLGLAVVSVTGNFENFEYATKLESRKYTCDQRVGWDWANSEKGGGICVEILSTPTSQPAQYFDYYLLNHYQ